MRLKNYCFRGFSILLLTALYYTAYSQYYVVGQDPASIRWKYIKTGHFKIIYPENFELKAQGIANDMEKVFNYDRKTMTFDPKPCPIILHNQTIEPNGFTMWAPRRIEFYTCPSQSSYPQEWLKQLSIHEYRHYVQMSKLNQGFTKWLSYFLGEQGTGITLGLFEPTWFMEGDAVAIETTCSNSGRGRLPSFEMELRAQVLNKRKYSFDKAIFGSYKNYIPDIYQIGYQLVAYTRKVYGPDVWEKTLDIVAKKPFIITPFNKGLKQSTGMGKVKLYEKTLSALDSLWTKQYESTINNEQLTNFKNITNNTKNEYRRYKYPAYINDSIIFAERSGIDDINRFVAINKRTGKEKIIYTPGLYSTDNIKFVSQFGNSFKSNKPGSLTADNITMGKGLIVWTEKIVDKRWNYRSYSVIKIFNIEKGKAKQITRKTRYFAPAISPDATKLVVSKVTEDNLYSLVLVDIKTGKETKTIISSDKDFYITPNWTPDSKNLITVILNNKGKRIDMINYQSGKSRNLIPVSSFDISNPKAYGKYIFYNAPYSGIDNIYALDTTGELRMERKIFRVTNSKFGAYNLDINVSHSGNVKHLIYSDYSANGYDIVEMDYNPESWVPLENINDNSIKLYKDLLKQETGNLDNDTSKQITFTSKKYNKILNLFNIHSWAPAYLDINNIDIKPGVSLLSQNLLSTAITSVGYFYNINEKHGKYFADISYAGFYPVFNLRYEVGQRDGFTANNFKYNYIQTDIIANVNLPLSFTTGKYYQFIQPVIGFDYSLKSLRTKDVYFRHKISDNLYYLYDRISIPSLYYKLFAYNLLKTSARDLYPKWGQVIDVNYAHNPFNQPYDTKDISSIFSYAATLYFPGLVSHHSFSVYGAYQYKNIGYNDFSTSIRLPYSYSDIYDERLYMLSFAYRLPLFYPDWSLGSIAYFKRLKGGVFYDYATNNLSSASSTNVHLYRSAGVELRSDMQILRFVAPFDLGVRAIYSPDLSSKYLLQFLFAINIRDI